MANGWVTKSVNNRCKNTAKVIEPKKIHGLTFGSSTANLSLIQLKIRRIRQINKKATLNKFVPTGSSKFFHQKQMKTVIIIGPTIGK